MLDDRVTHPVSHDVKRPYDFHGRSGGGSMPERASVDRPSRPVTKDALDAELEAFVKDRPLE